MNSIIKQIEQSEYEIEWFNFLNVCNIDVIDNEIQELDEYSKEFQSFIIKKAKKYIKAKFSSWERLRVSATYSNFFNIEREKLNKEVQTLVGQFFTWKKKKDDEMREEVNKLILNTETKILQEQKERKSIQARLQALKI